MKAVTFSMTPFLMNTPKEKALVYVIVVIVLTVVIYFLISTITSTIFVSRPLAKEMME
ncbi:MAG: hypothetical protein NZ809_02575 [Thermodesulfovibrio sp.]|nr:hypothetical protein [Thermodesulfovibrio sp.]